MVAFRAHRIIQGEHSALEILNSITGFIHRFLRLESGCLLGGILASGRRVQNFGSLTGYDPLHDQPGPPPQLLVQDLEQDELLGFVE